MCPLSTFISRRKLSMPDWRSIFQDLKTTGQIFTVYLRYMQRDTLAKIPNVRVQDVFDDYVRLENPSGYGVLGFDDILYISIPRAKPGFQ
jgi:hypothetical protein